MTACGDYDSTLFRADKGGIDARLGSDEGVAVILRCDQLAAFATRRRAWDDRV